MSHRIYLYNISGLPAASEERPAPTGIDAILASYGTNGDGVLMLTEWGYELPLLLQPLLAGDITILPPLYNGTEGGLYAPASAGITAIRALYDFIDRHKKHLIKNQPAFEHAKDQLLQFLDNKAVFPYFHLDAWDVFNVMDDGSEGNHAAQARVLAESIKANNAAITAAIAADDPALLDACPYFASGDAFFRNFRELLNEETYHYGWAVIDSFEPETSNEPEVFRDGDRYGLKDVMGQEILPAVYEDAYVLTGNQIAVMQQGLWGIIDFKGNTLVDFRAAQDVAVDYSGHYAHYIFYGADGRNQYFTHRFRPLAEGRAISIDMFGEYYILKQGNRVGLKDADGNEVLPADYKNIRAEYALNGLIAEDGNGKGLYAPQKGWVLPCIYQALHPLKDVGDSNGEVFVVVMQNKRTGLFTAGSKPGWVLPMEYDGVKWIKKDIFGYQQNKHWGLAGIAGNIITSPIYKSLSGKGGELAYGTALGFHDAGIDVISRNGDTRPINVNEAKKELRDAKYYFSKAETAQLEQIAAPQKLAESWYQKGEDALGKEQFAKALEHYGKAAELGHSGAMTDIGFIYETADDFINYQLAFDWYSKAALLENQYGMNNLALSYLYGRGTEQDTAMAIHWLEKAAAAGHAGALTSLGEIYFQPEYNHVDLDKALQYYWDAYKANEDVSLFIGNIHEKKGDHTNAVFYYKEAAQKGSAFAKWRLGCFYTDGTGVASDLNVAMNYYLEAVDEQPEVHVDLAILYMSSTFYDPAKARAHIDAAEAAGVPYADEYREKFRNRW